MRLWHKDLIPVLPRQQLLGQWRECCLIAKNIAEKGTPNHILVNPVMDYPIEHFISYARMVFDEMDRRDYNVHSTSFDKYFTKPFYSSVPSWIIFKDWHNKKYLTQCLANLEEKHDRGGIADKEWEQILAYIGRIRMRQCFDLNKRGAM